MRNRRQGASILSGADGYLVVKNPLSPVEHQGGIGVNCELFELGVEQFVVSDSKSLHFLSLQADDRLIRLPRCKIE